MFRSKEKNNNPRFVDAGGATNRRANAQPGTTNAAHRRLREFVQRKVSAGATGEPAEIPGRDGRGSALPSVRGSSVSAMPMAETLPW